MSYRGDRRPRLLSAGTLGGRSALPAPLRLLRPEELRWTRESRPAFRPLHLLLNSQPPPGCLCQPLSPNLHAPIRVSSLPFPATGPFRGPRTGTGLGKLTLPSFDLVHASCLRAPLAWRTHGGAGLPSLSRDLDAAHGRASAQRGGENGGREGDSRLAGTGARAHCAAPSGARSRPGARDLAILLSAAVSSLPGSCVSDAARSVRAGGRRT